MPAADIDFKQLLEAWDCTGEVVRPIGDGHINDTYRVDDAYILQCINARVFPNPAAVVRNQHKVCEHEGGKMLIAPLPTRAGEDFVLDAQGDTWRLMPYVRGRSFALLPDALLEPAGDAFGRFIATFRSFREPLDVVIAGFHDLSHYLERYDAVAAGAPLEMREVVDVLRDGFRVPVVSGVIHGDCKINNLIFHGEQDRVVAIVDLDTVMRGDAAWDFGDLVRSVCAGTDETSAVAETSMTRLSAVSRGFLGGLGEGVDDAQRFAEAPARMSFMLAVRFLTDHLEGDVYFKVAERGDNLARARTQFALAQQFLAPHVLGAMREQLEADPRGERVPHGT